MCGIVAILDKRGEPIDEQALRRMVQTLRHRGPDANGMFIQQNTGLGHTRLSIVDLEQGSQPMRSPDGRYVIVFNGEIYNYKQLRTDLEGRGQRFATASDTEVLVAAYAEWGEGCLDKLRGMFAFVILDTRSGDLFSARDRLGIKPLFIFEDGTTLAFVSEMKAALASGLCPARLDPLTVHDLLAFGHTLPGFTPFDGIRELEPGCCASVKGGRLKMRRYWEMPRPAGAAGRRFDVTASKEELYGRLREAVSSHLTGDVPIACYLSGGIDSNSVAHMLKEISFPVYRSYSMVFGVQRFDERREIEQSVRDHGLPNKTVEIGPDAVQRYADVIYHLEQPQWWTLDAAFYNLAESVREDGIKVSLSGQGSDELLAGYDIFRYQRMTRFLRRFPISLFRRRLLRQMVSEPQYAGDMADFLVEVEDRPFRGAIPRYGMVPSRLIEWNMLAPRGQGLLTESAWLHAGAAAERQQAFFDREIRPNVAGLDPLSQSLYLECRTRLPNFILWKEDRMNMAHGVETRPPFLDHQFVEFCASLPADVKLRAYEEKYILREAMRNRLRDRHVTRRKKPFSTPTTEWLQTQANAEFLRESLRPQNVRDLGVFSIPSIDDALRVVLDEPVSDPQSLRSIRAEWLVMLALGYHLLHQRLSKSADAVPAQA